MKKNIIFQRFIISYDNSNYLCAAIDAAMTLVCFCSSSGCVKNISLDGGGLGISGNFTGVSCLVFKNGFSTFTDIFSLTFEV